MFFERQKSAKKVLSKELVNKKTFGYRNILDFLAFILKIFFY